MPLDETLLAATRAATEGWRAAQRATEQAKAEYQRSVRRLHLSGASLREIADALDLSHQRVHQLVEAAGGVPDWRPRKEPSGRACSFCATPEEESARLVAGPQIFICDNCVNQAQLVLAGHPSRLDQAAGRFTCSFCAKPATEVGPVATGPGVRICGGCAGFAAEVLAATLGG
ncbi:ClpX C4-type zinc finger protein [Crossiella cryophila]|uniref:Bacterioferritin-associated ferredoxin n=1 Tax=Crossiella cryophila TaxID=43355 RepID=A0A7W7C9I5_9PSEU|nr:ClpX C4-type zinc finger protein [Crossiella cryophila]MBB4675811.1 bacterioferritin-associated ferredoxin [Crossiella cryophila]